MYKKLVVLLNIDPTENFGSAKGYMLSKLPKVGGALATLVPAPLNSIASFYQLSTHCLKDYGFPGAHLTHAKDAPVSFFT